MDKKVAQLYKGKFEELDILFSRVWAMPSSWTFTIHPIKTLLEKYVGDGQGWIDPFAGKNSPAQYTNDHNPANAEFYKNKKHNGRLHYHSSLEAIEFSKMGDMTFNGALFDPPLFFHSSKGTLHTIGTKGYERKYLNEVLRGSKVSSLREDKERWICHFFRLEYKWLRKNSGL